MPSLTLNSENTQALEVLKAHARELNVEVSEERGEDDTDEYYFLKGVKVRKAQGEIDIKQMSGSFPDLGLNPETYRKDLWTRNKE